MWTIKSLRRKTANPSGKADDFFRVKDMDDYCDSVEENSPILKELLEDFVDSFSKHRTVVDELCLTPFYTYVNNKFRWHIHIAYGAVLVFLIVNVLTLLIMWDVRSIVRRARKL